MLKLYQPVFSIIVILIQLGLSIFRHLDHVRSIEANPELYEIIHVITTYRSLFLFVFIIGLYEMTTQPSYFKMFLRIFLVCIVLGTHFSGLVPIDDFYYGVYNTAWFSAILAGALFLNRIGQNTKKRTQFKKAKNE